MECRVAHRSPPQQFFGECIYTMQLILRWCGCGVGGAEQMVERNAARFIYAYLSKFNRKILHMNVVISNIFACEKKIERLLYFFMFILDKSEIKITWNF